MNNIEGDWNAKKVYLNCGYTSVWNVKVLDEQRVVVSEHWGSYCCGCVPNLCPKRGIFAYHMEKKKGSDSWTGWKGGKPIKLTIKTDNELYHLTTMGPMVMTRN